jgi:hypothetical protein
MLLHAKQMINMQPQLKQMDQNTKAAEMIKKFSQYNTNIANSYYSRFSFAGVKLDNKKANDPPLTRVCGCGRATQLTVGPADTFFPPILGTQQQNISLNLWLLS